MKYSCEKIEENISYVWHTEGETKTLIAITENLEKAHFIKTCCNSFKLANSQTEKLREALRGVIKDWGERMGGDVEEHKTSYIDGKEHSYWSPSASMVSSSCISKAREALKEHG